jgi:hypothetical protein
MGPRETASALEVPHPSRSGHPRRAAINRSDLRSEQCRRRNPLRLQLALRMDEKS